TACSRELSKFLHRFVIIGAHQPEEALDAIIDVTERSRLLTITPDLDFAVACQFRDRTLPAQRRRRLLATTVPRPERPEDVVEAHGSRLDPIVFAVMLTQALGNQVFPSVRILRRS